MFEFLTPRQPEMPSAEDALPGRDVPIVTPGEHFVLGTPIGPPFPEGTQTAVERA